MLMRIRVRLTTKLKRVWGKEVVSKMKICGERKRGSNCQRVIQEILLLYGAVFDLYRSDMYIILSEGNNNNNEHRYLPCEYPNHLLVGGMIFTEHCYVPIRVSKQLVVRRIISAGSLITNPQLDVRGILRHRYSLPCACCPRRRSAVSTS